MKQFIAIISMLCFGIATGLSATMPSSDGLLSSGTTINTPPASPPTNLINAFKKLGDYSGDKEKSLSATKYNSDGSLQYQYSVLPFVCKSDEQLLRNVRNAFDKDKNCGYSYVHYPAGSLSATKIEISTSGSPTRTIPVRTDANQETYILQVKNTENPRMKDIYALVVDPPKEYNDLRHDANGHWLFGRQFVEGRIITVTRRFSASEFNNELLGIADIVPGQKNDDTPVVDTVAVYDETLTQIIDGDNWGGVSLESLQSIGYDKATLVKIQSLRSKLALYKQEIADVNRAMEKAPDARAKNIYLKRLKKLNKDAQKVIDQLGRLLNK